MSLWIKYKVQALSRTPKLNYRNSMNDISTLLKTIQVAVAIIRNQHGQILITQRALNVPHGGLWEVPGGKLEPGEAAYDAIVREVAEEVGLNIQHAEFLGVIPHTYPNQQVHLHVFEVTAYNGEPNIHDGQLAMHWIEPNEYLQYEFPEANHKIMQLLLASSNT